MWAEWHTLYSFDALAAIEDGIRSDIEQYLGFGVEEIFTGKDLIVSPEWKESRRWRKSSDDFEEVREMRERAAQAICDNLNISSALRDLARQQTGAK